MQNICKYWFHEIFFPSYVYTVGVWQQNVQICPLHFTTRRYNPCRILADSSRLQPSLSLTLILQFLTPSLSASLITPSILLRFGLPTHLRPSGLSKTIFLHGRLSCIRTICPAHLSLIILIVVTRSIFLLLRCNLCPSITVIPRLTKIILSRITFVSRNLR